MVDQKVGPNKLFQRSTEDAGEIDNLDDKEWRIQFASEEETVMAEADISRVEAEETEHQFLINIDEGTMVSASHSQELTEPSMSRTQSAGVNAKIQNKLEELEERISIIENLIDIEHFDQNLESNDESEYLGAGPAEAVEHNSSADDVFSI